MAPLWFTIAPPAAPPPPRLAAFAPAPASPPSPPTLAASVLSRTTSVPSPGFVPATLMIAPPPAPPAPVMLPPLPPPTKTPSPPSPPSPPELALSVLPSTTKVPRLMIAPPPPPPPPLPIAAAEAPPAPPAPPLLSDNVLFWNVSLVPGSVRIAPPPPPPPPAPVPDLSTPSAPGGPTPSRNSSWLIVTGAGPVRLSRAEVPPPLTSMPATAPAAGLIVSDPDAFVIASGVASVIVWPASPGAKTISSVPGEPLRLPTASRSEPGPLLPVAVTVCVAAPAAWIGPRTNAQESATRIAIRLHRATCTRTPFRRPSRQVEATYPPKRYRRQSGISPGRYLLVITSGAAKRVLIWSWSAMKPANFSHSFGLM